MNFKEQSEHTTEQVEFWRTRATCRYFFGRGWVLAKRMFRWQLCQGLLYTLSAPAAPSPGLLQCRDRIPIWEGDSLFQWPARKLVSHTIGVSLTVGTNDAGPKKYRRQVGGIIDCRCFWLVAAFIICPTVLFCSRCFGKCVIVLNGQIILTEGGVKADISQALQNPYLHLLHLCIIHHFQFNYY